MSYTYSRALVEEYSQGNSSVIDASAQSNGSHTHKPCLWHDKTMEPSRLSRFGMTCAHLTAARGAELLMSFVEDSRARTSAQPEVGGVSTVSVRGCGEKWPESSVKYDLDSHSWKTAHCLWEEDLPWSSVTLPKWGMTRNGSVCRHPTLERPISVTGYGLWPTPNCIGYRSDGELAILARTLKDEAEYRAMSDRACNSKRERFWPTATATAYKGWSPNHNRASSDDRLDYSVERESFQPGQQTPPMRLNPEWVEWLMGWPIGHTGLKPLGTGRYQEWLQQHSRSFQAENKEAE